MTLPQTSGRGRVGAARWAAMGEACPDSMARRARQPRETSLVVATAPRLDRQQRPFLALWGRRLRFQRRLWPSQRSLGIRAGSAPAYRGGVPTFTPAAGTYTAPQTVTISTATLGSTIYDTTAGVTTPTASSMEYDGAITVPPQRLFRRLSHFRSQQQRRRQRDLHHQFAAGLHRRGESDFVYSGGRTERNDYRHDNAGERLCLRCFI